MRDTHWIQEPHLMECVRQKVISTDQMDQILALSRTMARSESQVLPDFEWVRSVHSLAAAAAFAIAASAFYSTICNSDLMTVGIESLGMLAVFVLGAWMVRRSGGTPAAASIFTVAAAWSCWGIGAAVWGIARGLHGDSWSPLGVETQSEIMVMRLGAFIAGDVLVILAAIFLGRRRRVAMAMLPAAIALVHLGMSLVEITFTREGHILSERASVPYLFVFAVIFVVAARALDVRNRSTRDPAFWLHFVALAILGYVAGGHPGTTSGDAMVWVLMALPVGLLGIFFERKLYFAAAALWLLGFPMSVLAGRPGSDGLGFVSLGLALGILALGASVIRRYGSARWLQGGVGGIARTVWE